MTPEQPPRIEEIKMPEQELDEFHAEIATLKDKERQAYENGTGTSGHFFEMDPSRLDAEDMRIWKKFRADALEFDEFNKYRLGTSGRRDSHDFAAYLGNQIEYWYKKMRE